MNFKEKVWDKCRQIPKGKVTTYKELAKAIDTRAYRAVGSALKNNPFAPTVPCHRVVKSDGTLGGYDGKMNSKKKIDLLKRENVQVVDGRIEKFDKVLFSF